jgi:glycosyltransferase involved in cell wall biosynthesis
MITIFTPSFADESDTNAQNLTVKEVVARLDPAKFHVTLLNEAAPDPRVAERPNTQILQWRPRANTLRVLWRLLRNVPDIYFFPREGPLDAGFLQLRRRLGLRTALVTYVVSGGELDNGNPRATLARNIREGDAVIGNSTHMTRLLRERIGVEAGTVHDGIDRRYFFPAESGAHDRDNDCLTVLFAGSLRPYKRAHLVMRQASRWPAVNFRIAGRGEEEENCRKLADELRCRNVSFLGHLTSQQLGEEMRRADVFLFPSIVEGHPQVLGQAAASGLPAVAMDIYHPDFLVHGKTGFLATSDEDLEQKLDWLLTQPELRKSMRQAAIAHARQFDWDLVTTRWEDVFEEVMAARRKR